MHFEVSLFVVILPETGLEGALMKYNPLFNQPFSLTFTECRHLIHSIINRQQICSNLRFRSVSHIFILLSPEKLETETKFEDERVSVKKFKIHNHLLYNNYLLSPSLP